MPPSRQSAPRSGPALPLLIRQILVPERIRAHPIRPVGTRNRHALANLVGLLDATVHALGPDHLKEGVASQSSLLKFTRINLPGIAAYELTAIDLIGRFFTENLLGLRKCGIGPGITRGYAGLSHGPTSLGSWSGARSRSAAAFGSSAATLTRQRAQNQRRARPNIAVRIGHRKA